MFLYLVLSVATYMIATYLFHKIRNLPPTPFPILPILGHLHLLKKPLHHCLSRLASRHGPIMFLHFGYRPVLVVSSPSAAEECLTKNDIVFANRPHLLVGKYVGNNYTNIAWSSYGDHWRNLRKMASLEVLSNHRLQTLMSIRADEVSLLARRLSMQHDETVELHSVLFELVLNCMMRMVCGRRCCGDNVKKTEGVNMFHQIVTEGFELSETTNVVDFLPFVAKIGFNSAEKKIQRLQVKRNKLLQNLVDELKTVESGDDAELDGKKKKNMIQVLLNLQKTDPECYDDVAIKSIMGIIIGAGTDTTVTELEWAMSLLLNHPQVLKKAQEEIDTIVGVNRFVTELDLPNLPYLRCIIAETFRLYPGGPLSVPHESSSECFVGGYRVPKGTMLLLNLYAIQRDPSLWPEADKFKPERFEGVEGVRVGYKMMPFGAGRRGCPGENLALRMVGVTLGVMIQCFEWDRVSQEMVDMTEGQGLTMPRANPLVAKCRTRQGIKMLLSQVQED